MPVFLVLSIIFATSMLIVCKMTIRIVRLKAKPCHQVICEMRYVDLTEVAQVAREVLFGQARDRTSADLIDSLGGIEGLERLRYNAGAMIDVARFLTLMRPDDDVVAHLIREDALVVQRLVFLLKWQFRCGIPSPHPRLVRHLARRYCNLSDNMVDLCNAVALEMVPVLNEALSLNKRSIRADVAQSAVYF